MKQLAADTQKVAVHTYMDGANMRMMTLINLLTLPGTFTAVSDPVVCVTSVFTRPLKVYQTFFSTGFFDFSPKGSNSIVSNWIWIYFVVTLGLTIVLFTYWLFWVSRACKRGQLLLVTTGSDDRETFATKQNVIGMEKSTRHSAAKRPPEPSKRDFMFQAHAQIVKDDDDLTASTQSRSERLTSNAEASATSTSTSYSLLDSTGLSFRKDLFPSSKHFDLPYTSDLNQNDIDNLQEWNDKFRAVLSGGRGLSKEVRGR